MVFENNLDHLILNYIPSFNVGKMISTIGWQLKMVLNIGW
jgi:hypothetical protein